MSFMDYLDTAADAAVDTSSNWLGNVGGAVSHAYDAASGAASGADSWWDTALGWGTRAFEWMEDYPTATKVLGGAVGGIGSYLSQRELQGREAELLREQWERERQAQMISPGKVNNYGSHTNQFSGGLLTGGPIAGYRGLRDRNGGA